MLDTQKWMDVSDPRRRMITLTALAGIIVLLGFFCHHPEALGHTTGPIHSGQPGLEHCWTSVASFPTLGFVPIFFALLLLSPTLHGRLLCDSPFKPPRAIPSVQRLFIHL